MGEHAVNRWRQRLAELHRETLAAPHSASTFAVRNVQNIQNLRSARPFERFEHFEQIEQQTNSSDEPLEVKREDALVETPDSPVLLRDGRCLWRFRTDAIPEHASETTVGLVEKAQWHGLVLVADGLELIVVRPWLGFLSYEMLEHFQRNSGEVIALLRRQSRIRCPGREQVLEPAYRNQTDEQ
jgi:hypothetical protein